MVVDVYCDNSHAFVARRIRLDYSTPTLKGKGGRSGKVGLAKQRHATGRHEALYPNRYDRGDHSLPPVIPGTFQVGNYLFVMGRYHDLHAANHAAFTVGQGLS